MIREFLRFKYRGFSLEAHEFDVKSGMELGSFAHELNPF
jgi:hypothetical protein